MAALLVVCAPCPPRSSPGPSESSYGCGRLGSRRRRSVADLGSVPMPRATAHVLPGLLLIGLGTGLPVANGDELGRWVGSQDDSGIGSAINTMALQVGGAIGVAVIGSVLATRYQNHMSRALAGRHLPTGITHTILGSFGGALAVAGSAGSYEGRTVRGCCTRGVHERFGGFLSSRCRCRVRRCHHRARRLPSRALPGAPCERPDDERPLQGSGETSQQVWASQSGLSSTEASTASISCVPVVKRPRDEFDQRGQRDEASHEPCREAVGANECPEPQVPDRIRLARKPLEWQHDNEGEQMTIRAGPRSRSHTSLGLDGSSASRAMP